MGKTRVLNPGWVPGCHHYQHCCAVSTSNCLYVLGLKKSATWPQQSFFLSLTKLNYLRTSSRADSLELCLLVWSEPRRLLGGTWWATWSGCTTSLRAPTPPWPTSGLESTSRMSKRSSKWSTRLLCPRIHYTNKSIIFKTIWTLQ